LIFTHQTLLPNINYEKPHQKTAGGQLTKIQTKIAIAENCEGLQPSGGAFINNALIKITLINDQQQSIRNSQRQH
jgi:hypothetical protein